MNLWLMSMMVRLLYLYSIYHSILYDVAACHLGFMFSSDKKKRSRDSNGPIKLEWPKGCVIILTGLSTTTCDHESIREAVSETLGVSTDVKTSGLYVD